MPKIRLPVHTHRQPQRVIGQQAGKDLILIADLPLGLITEWGHGRAAIGMSEQYQLLRMLDGKSF